MNTGTVTKKAAAKGSSQLSIPAALVPGNRAMACRGTRVVVSDGAWEDPIAALEDRLEETPITRCEES
jgi:hypothetical protein